MGEATGSVVDGAVATLHDEVIPGVVAAQQRIAQAEAGGDPKVLRDAYELLAEVAAVTHMVLSRLIRVRIVDLSEGTVDLTAAGLGDLAAPDGVTPG